MTLLASFQHFKNTKTKRKPQDRPNLFIFKFCRFFQHLTGSKNAETFKNLPVWLSRSFLVLKIFKNRQKTPQLGRFFGFHVFAGFFASLGSSEANEVHLRLHHRANLLFSTFSIPFSAQDGSETNQSPSRPQNTSKFVLFGVFLGFLQP